MFKRVIREEHRVPANINHLGEMRDFITRVGRRYGVSERIINSFKLAIDEAGTNIIRHAYRDWEGFITIRMIIREKNVTISLLDQGHTFDPRKVKDPDLQRYVDIGKKGGLGIFIIRRVIDDIEYRKTEEGNELRLTKERVGLLKKHLSITGVSLTMKMRFSLIASAIWSVLVISGFIWNYIRQDNIIFQRDMDTGRALAKTLADQCIDKLVEEQPWELAKIVLDFQNNHAPLVTEALVLDTANVIQGALRNELILQNFRLPSGAKRIRENLFHFRRYHSVDAVYDIVEPILLIGAGLTRRVGTVHLLLNKAVIDQNIAASRNRILMISLILLCFGCLGVFILVYVTMSPFRKLSNWIRALGHGEVQDEMDFDSSDEIGEIAHAFNEITEKFRKSQENLAEQERLQKEMQVAQEIQHTLLPDVFPEIEGYEIASYYEAAKEVGGDYFDFVEVDQDTLGIVVADVSGKGVPGSLVMTMIRTALRTEARGNKNAADVLSRVNDFVMNDMKRGMFVTIFYIILDSKNRTLNYASAGHNPMILYRGQTKKSYYLNPRGFPIGINLPDRALFRKSIESDTLQLKEDDVLIIYTDGITEAMNGSRERFGDERFLTTLRRYGDLKVDPLVDQIRQEINYFTGGQPQSDDITLVAIREKMKAEDVLFNLRTKLLNRVNEEGMSVKEACKSVGVSTSTYYKYKKRFEKMGVDGLRERTVRSEVEEKHISIEDTAKIYDIIKEHPEYGAKRISEELNTEKYGNTEIDEKYIYDELVKSRLNTKELRNAFIERGGRGKRIKPPGTPLLTLDGQVIIEPRMKKDEAGLLPHEEEEHISYKKHVSQKVPEESSGEVEEVEAREDSVLDEFLSLAEDTEREIEQDFMQGDEEQAIIPFEEEDMELHINEDILEERVWETDGEDFILEEKDREEEEQVAEQYDEVFDGLIGGIEEIADGDLYSNVNEDEIRLQQILDTDENTLSSFSGGEEQIEENISTSIVRDFLTEEIEGIEDPIKHKAENPEEEGFIEMMERLGFDRRTVFSWEKSKNQERVSGAQLLNRKRFFESGQLYYQQGLYAKAIDEFRKAIEIDSQFIEAYQCLGDAFFRLDHLDKAMDAYERVRHLDPDNIHVLENLGVIFANRGDFKKAVWQWSEILKRNPNRGDIINRIKQMQKMIRHRSVYQKKS